MADPSVPGEQLLARRPSMRRLAVAVLVAVALGVAIWAAIWGDHWSSHGTNGTHSGGAATQPPRI